MMHWMNNDIQPFDLRCFDAVVRYLYASF